ncbi:uncharacterized protein LOC144169893 isoform X2 [Haemaphysalis longicornis]
MPMCCAFGCTNRVADGKRLFAIPSGEREAARRKVWMRRIGRADFKVTLSARLCEDHFTEDQYEPVILQKHGVKKLKADATPSIFHHQSPLEQPALPALRDPPLCIQDWPLSLHTPGESSAVCTEAAPPQNGTELLPTAAAHQGSIEAVPQQSDTELLPAAGGDQKEGSQGSPCLVCGRPVTFLCEFLSDVHTHRARISKKFVCGHCLQEFTKYDGLMAHITGIGSALKFTPNAEKKARLPLVVPRRHFPCFHCYAVFETSSARLNHMVMHTAAARKGLRKAFQRNPKTASGAPEKGVQQYRLKKRPRSVKILAKDPSQICLDDVPKPAPPRKMIVKVIATSESSPGPSEICLYDVPKLSPQPNTACETVATSESSPGPSQICRDGVPKRASQRRRIVKVVTTSESSRRNRQVRIVAPCLLEVSKSVSVVQKQSYVSGRERVKTSAPCPSASSPNVPEVQQRPETAAKKLNSASSLPRSRQIIILCPSPSKVCPSVPIVPKQPETTVKKLNNASSLPGKRPLNTFRSLPEHQKQQILPTVSCNCCDRQFPTLKLLDKHYWLHHSNRDLPLDLAFEIGSGDVAPAATVCSSCAKLTVCMDTLSRLLKEAARDGEM